MTSVTTLKNRRQELQSRRRLRLLQSLWRSLVAGSLAAGLLWAIALPEWVIREKKQIQIEGNRYLSEEEIRTLLPITYPQPLLFLKTPQLIQQFKTTAPITEATVTRQMLPPRLIVTVLERPPVAIALAPDAKSSSGLQKLGFLDAQGILVPGNFYTQLSSQSKLPTLKVIGTSDQYLRYWPTFYQQIARSPIKIFEIDWRNPSNLIVRTELGTVYLGAGTSQLSQQLKVLARLRELPTRVSASQIAYIDLTNPKLPEIQFKERQDKTAVMKNKP